MVIKELARLMPLQEGEQAIMSNFNMSFKERVRTIRHKRIREEIEFNKKQFKNTVYGN